MAVAYQHPRGRRSALDTLAASNAIVTGQIYALITESRIAVGTSPNTYEVFAKQAEVTGVKGVVWSVTGKSTASEVFPGTVPYDFSSAPAYSLAQARVAATASTVFQVRRNNTVVATVTFAAGATFGVWNNAVAWLAGDFVTITAPAAPDATLADIVFTAMAPPV